MPEKQPAQILCVDDEPNVLEGLSMHLQRNHAVFTATNGREALELLREKPNIAVVISDMRMPQMDGATFLAKARQLAPQAVRILLTGQTELESAISAVNDGQLFRFLTKPCPPSSLLRAVDDAIEQHKLVTAERILLEQTVHGSIKALTDVLALVDPVSFGRANRIKRLVVELCSQLGITERWYIEVAAMLSQLGHMTLPAETVQKLETGEALDAQERQMVARLPTVVDQLIGSIPRLEPVRELLIGALRDSPARPLALSGAGQQKRVAASVLRIALDYDQLETKGVRGPALVVELRTRAERYETPVLDALAKLRERPSSEPELRWVTLSALRVGMVFAQDLRSKTGILLAARGFEVTDGFIERVRNLRAGSVPERVNIY
jgi:response regulator RpfG family c-di-GMP phosphodiesterase